MRNCAGVVFLFDATIHRRMANLTISCNRTLPMQGNVKDDPVALLQGDIAVFRRDLLEWFEKNRRDFYWRSEDASLYVRIVSEVLLQRTQARTASNFLPAFLDAFPTWNAIAEAGQDVLEEVLRPIGLWRRRATALFALASEVVRRGGIWPLSRQELESIPAVGQYVASAILLFQHNSRAPLLDASMARLLRRYFAITPELADIRYDKGLQKVAHEVLACGDPVALNWAILDFAAIQCRKPAGGCMSCALKQGCRQFQVKQNPDC